MTSIAQDIDTLIALCKEGSRNAQFEVYNRYYKPLYNTALRIVKDAYWAEDVMQEAFIKAFSKLDSFKGEVTFGAWLKRIVVNQSIDQYKRQNRDMADSINDVLYKIEDEGSRQEDVIDFQQLKAQQVLGAIQSLKESYRVMLTLQYIEGYDQEEISEILGITHGNCRTTISRAKEALLKRLKEV